MTEEHNTHAEESHGHDDSAVILGRKLPVPIYTVVLFGLALLTIIEVALFELPRGVLTAPVMMIIALVKAALVVWFYMHLNKDSRIFALTLITPVIIVVVATLFLLLASAPGY